VQGAGCRNCRNTGFRGRIGAYELLSVSEHIREMVMQRINAPSIAARATADGDLFLLKDDGFAKARAGLTTLGEVVRAMKG